MQTATQKVVSTNYIYNNWHNDSGSSKIFHSSDKEFADVFVQSEILVLLAKGDFCPLSLKNVLKVYSVPST
jgi:hypothetical protein